MYRIELAAAVYMGFNPETTCLDMFVLLVLLIDLFDVYGIEQHDWLF